MMKAEDIIKLIQSDDNCAYKVYGLRADRPGIEIGTVLPNSHQWWQDYQDYWEDLPDPDDYNSNPDHPYNEELGCWDDGELPGVCTLGIKADADIGSIQKVIEQIEMYRNGSYTSVYLVTGDCGFGGNDIGEEIIEDGTVLALVDD